MNQKIGKPYMEPTKLVWNENGQKVRVPDTAALDNPFVPTPVTDDNNYSTTPVKEFKYEKTLDQVLSSTDRFQFNRLKTEELRYAFVKNMITGLNDDFYPKF